MSWAEIAPLVGHPHLSCATKMSEIRARRQRAGGAPPPSKRGRPPKPYVPQRPPAIPAPPSARSCRTSTLLADAELRARIEVLGPTGGLCGDPMPGRSALDQKRAGLTEPAPSHDRRFSDNRLKVSLPTEPLR